MRTGLTAALSLCAATGGLGAQTPPAAGAPPAGAPLAVYLDCRSGCDTDLIRTEISWVNWVRDRVGSDVHVLVTSQGAGAGSRFTVAFLGARAFAGRGDTLTFSTNATTTGDEQRRGVLQAISVGLVQFLAHTPALQSLRIAPGDAGKPGNGQTKPASDPWNAWVFSVGVNGFTNGEQYYKNRSLYSRLSARRVTEAWKTDASLSHSYNDNSATVQSYDSVGAVTSEETYTSLQRDWSSEVLQVKSLGDHWSLGGYVGVASQTYRNQDLKAEGLLAVEYNLMPYREATRRELLLRYGVGIVAYKYTDTTIFNRIRETLPTQRLEVEFNTKQPWGSANFSGEHRNVLNDAAKRSTRVSGSFNVRLFRGFGVNAGASYQWIHDQLYLPRGEQSTADVLLRRRALLTGYQYSMHFGVNYTFGSIYNNVVNPRF